MAGDSAVPYITLWSTERPVPSRLYINRVGIGFTDETPGERDETGVLWCRMTSAPRQGRPVFAKVHAPRQRRAMAELLCQVCGCPADVTSDGALWLFPKVVAEQPGWPDWMKNAHPPVCRPCASLSARLCPAMHRGYVAVRAHSEVTAVSGILFRPSHLGPRPAGDVVVPFGDPELPWTLATELVRTLHNCTPVDLDELAEATAQG
jgi:hypothetical protein